MIHYIEFSDGGGDSGCFELHLDSLKGKRFDFRPGVNVIIGKNGSGKTSLLNVIRRLTFCEGVFGSAETPRDRRWLLRVENNVDEGLYERVKMHTQFGFCTFNVRKSEELRMAECSSVLDYLQVWDSGNSSAGESQRNAVMMTLKYIREGGPSGSWNKDMTANGIPQWMDFEVTVLDEIRNSGLKDKDTVLKWYADNRFSCKTSPELTPYGGITILADEPDAGMDIEKLDELYGLYEATPSAYQHIVALHNVALIHKLHKMEANIIELTDGYLDEIEEFLKEG